MNAAGIQAKIYGGYAKAAKRVGYPTQVLRSTGALSPPQLVATLPASFNAEDMNYSKPNKYGHPTWYVLIDGTQTQVGDALQSSKDGNYFIAAMQSNLPILVVQANHTVSLARANADTGVGLQAYSGLVVSQEILMAQGVPASILLGSKGERNEVDLPTDTRTPLWSLLIPAPSGVVLRTSDIVIDELTRRYIIQSAELTDLGWRLTAIQAQA